MPQLSIITVNLNNARGLEATVNSVVAQTPCDFEFIIIDGGSTDGSVDILKSNDKLISHWVSEKDSGIYNAMNKGILKAKGNYLLFLNSGDWLENKDVVKNVLPLLNSFDVISGDIDIFDRHKWHNMSSEESLSISFFLRLSLYHQSTFISKELFEKYGLYNETFKIGGDYEFFIRALLNKGASYKHIKQVISKFKADGISNDYNMMARNMQEKELAWKLNFSETVIDELKNLDEMLQSNELKWGRRLNKYLLFTKNRV